MTDLLTKAGRWLVDRSRWDDGMRGFFVRINATAGPEDMRVHVLAIEREAVAAERARIRAAVEGLRVKASKAAETDYFIGYRQSRNETVSAVLAAIDGGRIAPLGGIEQYQDEDR